ncbi:hypothetical protein LOK49_LG01G01777 [Camellia lanceoleosa]|uniref:Uncharacterized protein n=1 Tax=Camellia lanceoleosa TaxID=1840588 RepID=A0ACC0J230_9ERIC|nr:hypothetical protein LOK49_LG01G01777 [Camellia lanceoleosa]
MVTTFENASGKIIPLTFAGRRPGDAEVVYASVDKAEHQLIWKDRLFYVAMDKQKDKQTEAEIRLENEVIVAQCEAERQANYKLVTEHHAANTGSAAAILRM